MMSEEESPPTPLQVGLWGKKYKKERKKCGKKYAEIRELHGTNTV